MTTAETLLAYHAKNDEPCWHYISKHLDKFTEDNAGGYVLVFHGEEGISHDYFGSYHKAAMYRDQLAEDQRASAIIWRVKRPGVVYKL